MFAERQDQNRRVFLRLCLCRLGFTDRAETPTVRGASLLTVVALILLAWLAHGRRRASLDRGVPVTKGMLHMPLFGVSTTPLEIVLTMLLSMTIFRGSESLA